MTIAIEERFSRSERAYTHSGIHLEEHDRLPIISSGTFPATDNLSGSDLWLISSEGVISTTAVRGKWLEAALRDLAHWANESPNWDGFGARSISPRLATRAENVLRVLAKFVTQRPFVTGTTEGGINLQWDTDSYDLQIAFSEEEITVFHWDKDTEEQWEGPLENALAAIEILVTQSSK